MKKFFLAILLVLTCWTASFAVPAMPGFTKFTQSDGTTISIQTVGDEFFSTFQTADGLTVDRAANGDWCYITSEGITSIIAHEKANRGTDEVTFIDAHKADLQPIAQLSDNARELIRKVNGMRKQAQVPSSGAVRIPILLIQYSDVKMTHTKAEFQAKYTTDAKSVYQYLYDQSNGKFKPQFDLYGIYTLDNTRATYGAHGTRSDGTPIKDVGLGTMVGEAVDKASAAGDLDWSNYDNDHDGKCDVVVVVFAGLGEAQAATTHPEAIWACQYDLYSAGYYGDGKGVRTYNNTKIDKFAVFNEIKGGNDTGDLDGIGTFCHEFTHCLGLPDFYDVSRVYSHFTMGDYDLLCTGVYVNDGDTPCGYNSYEKHELGWLDYINPIKNTQYTLTAMNQKSASTDMAIKIPSDINENEYFLLENRRKTGWDAYLNDEGLMIIHVSYVPSRWQYNSVNTQDVGLFTLVPADGVADLSTQTTDLFGKTNHTFTDTSTPAATLHLDASSNISENSGLLGKPVTEININDDGSVSLWYFKGGIQTYAPVMQPADASAIDYHKFRADWTYDRPNADKVASYTLNVSMMNTTPSLLENADFSNLGKEVTSEDKLANCVANYSKYLPTGWTCETQMYVYNGLIIGSLSALSTKTYDLTGYDKISIVAQGYGYSDESTITASTSKGSATATYAKGEYSTKTIVLDAAESDKVIFKSSSYTSFRNIKIYAGDVTASSGAPVQLIAETGDSNNRTITGITGNSYTVDNLTGGGTFRYKVKTVYTDGQESEWSNIQKVTLKASADKKGDVNGDGKVDTSDLSELIKLILNNATATDYPKADVNGDGKVDTTDVSALMTIILAN